MKDLAEVRKVREHLQLDYKQQPYGHNHSDAVEMLADITAMANAQGGYIVLGVEEDTSQPDGTPKEEIGIANGDTEAQWIQSVCISSIDEKIPGLRVRDIPLANGLSCVVIQVPNSPRKPHMVVHEKHRSFRLRHGRDKSYMGMQEVRHMILSMNTYRASLASFIEERKLIFRNIVSGKPWLLFMATPIYIDTDKVDPLRADIKDYLMKAPSIPDSRGYKGVSVGSPRATLFGIEAGYPETRPPQPYTKLLRLFRNGHLEYCEDRSADIPENNPQGAIRLESYRMAVTLLHFLDVASHIMQLAEVNEPIAVTALWENFNPSYLERGTQSSRDEISHWNEPSLPIEVTTADLSDPSRVTSTIIARLFNAFGYEDNPHFDKDGRFQKRK